MFYSTLLLLAFGALQVKGQTEGAITQPDPNDPCTPCFGINATVNTQNPTPWFYGESDMTCADLVATTSGGGLIQGDGQCKDYQLQGFQLGCCSSPPYEYCDVCPDGSAFTRSDVIPIGDPLRGDPTCAENIYRIASYVPIFTPGTCTDTVIQRGAFYCGCPNTEQQCYLCPDQQPPTNPERGDAWITNSNCGGIEFLFSLYTAQECTDYRESYGVDFAHFCKCPNYEKNSTGHCAMCEDGLENPDFIYTPEDAAFERTCEQAQAFAESITRENICLREMNAVIELGCKCKDGKGPVYHTETEGSSAATVTMSQLAVATIIPWLVHGLLAWH